MGAVTLICDNEGDSEQTITIVTFPWCFLIKYYIDIVSLVKFPIMDSGLLSWLCSPPSRRMHNVHCFSNLHCQIICAGSLDYQD